jgi:hypothetical protein
MKAMDKMLKHVMELIGSRAGDPRATKGLLVLQMKYIYEDSGVAVADVRDSLEELDRDGKICLFALPEGDLENVVIQLPESR